eukprot:6163690-Pleurochrysis_carterae.AAC.2
MTLALRSFARAQAWESAAEVRVVRADSAVDVDSYAPAPWRVELVRGTPARAAERVCDTRDATDARGRDGHATMLASLMLQLLTCRLPKCFLSV